MPTFDTGAVHPIQLALWGQLPMATESAVNAPAGTVFDVAKISIADSTDHSRPEISSRLSVNGELKPLTRYPMFKEFRKNSVVDDLPGFEKFPTRARICPYCHITMIVDDFYEQGPDGSDRSSGQLLEHCSNCTFWQLHAFRMQGYEARSTIFYNFDIAVLSSKIKEFETEYPNGSLDEVSQWLRRHPEKYNTMSPNYLETLVARVFEAAGTYVEVQHVGRPGDGGIDVLLVDSERNRWLVQVKRREDPASSEPVSTIRNVLGAMVLEGSKKSIVVSTADHFTHQARQAVDRARGKGFEIELIDRGVFNQIIGGSLPVSPWLEVREGLRRGDAAWMSEDWCFCGCLGKEKSDPYDDF